MRLLEWLLHILAYCPHARTTFPLTPRGKHTYIVCLECGAEFAYDWSRMQRGERIWR